MSMGYKSLRLSFHLDVSTAILANLLLNKNTWLGIKDLDDLWVILLAGRNVIEFNPKVLLACEIIDMGLLMERQNIVSLQPGLYRIFPLKCMTSFQGPFLKVRGESVNGGHRRDLR